LEAHGRILTELECEKREIEARLAAAPDPVDLPAVRAEIEAAVDNLRDQ
jgi:hypothetical protein